MNFSIEQFIPNYGTEKIVFDCVVFLFLFLLVLLYKNRATIFNQLHQIKKNVWFALFIFITIYALFLIVAAPKSQGMWLDESYHQAGAKNQLLSGTYSSCFLDAELQPDCEPMKANHGWGFFITVIYLLFGINNIFIIYFTLCLTICSVILVFLVTRLLTKNNIISFLSAILFSLLPVQIKWSGTTESNIPGLFVLLLAVYFMLLFKKTKLLNIALLSFGFLLFSMQIRIEHIFLLPLFFIDYIILKSKTEQKFQSSHYMILFLFLLVFVFGFLPQLGSSIQERNAPNLYSINSMIRNIGFQLPRFQNEYLIVPSYIALLGFVISLFSKRRQEYLFTALIFIIFFLFWPSRVLDSNQPRYYIPIFWVFAIFAAKGIYFIMHILKKISRQKWLTIPLQIIFVLFLFFSAHVVLYFDELYFIQEDTLYSEATRLPLMISNHVEPNAIIIGGYSEMLAIDGATSLQVMKTKTFLRLKNETKQMHTFYFFEGMLSLLPPFANREETKLSDELQSTHNLSVVNEISYENTTFTLYLINS